VNTTTAPRLWDHNLLRRWRDEAGMKPAHVADALGITVGWLYAVEGGTNGKPPNVELMITWCRFYGHELSELIIPADAVPQRARAAS